MKNKFPFISIVIVLLSYVYASIIQIGFADVDDKWMLLDVTLIQAKTFNLTFIKAVMFQINNLQYSPLNTFYYYFIYQINGYDPYYYHLSSLFIHVLNVALTYLLVKKLLDTFDISNSSILSFAIALVWAVLPFNVEAVVWISASKILLCTFFGNLSFICFVHAFTKSNKLLYAISILTFVLSFLAKEQAVLYSLAMGLFVCAYQLKFNSKLNVKTLALYAAPFIVLAFMLGLITTYIAVYGGGAHDIDRYPFGQRFILAFYCLYFYIFNCLVPVNLHYHYPFPIKLGHALPVIYYIFAIITLIMTWLIYNLLKSNKNKSLYVMGIGIFLIHLLLTLQIIPLPRAAMLADRYMYNSSVGVLLCFVTILNEKFDLSFKKMQQSHIIILACFIIYIIGLSIYSHNLVDSWKNMQL